MTEEPQTSVPSVAAVDTSSVMRCYVVLGLGMAAGMTNIPTVSLIGMAAMIFGIVWAYRIRAGAEQGGLVRNHASWMVRTFWVSSVYAVVAMMLYASVMYSNADMSSMDAYNEMLKAGEVDVAIVEKAVMDYKETNRNLIIWTTVFCQGPVILFVLARMVRGYRLADAGRFVENLRTWAI